MLDKIMELNNWQKRGYGSPYDRGSADAYYGRAPNPHWYPMGNGPRITEEDMSPEQLEDYRLGYVEETDRKEYD